METEEATQATQLVEQPAAPVQPAERLMIAKMVLTNFKSYAGEITIGPFDTNMTSVVGPNGSGKSNVIDSMLFVFGFKANKYAAAAAIRTAARSAAGCSPRRHRRGAGGECGEALQGAEC